MRDPIESAVELILNEIGEDPFREGLRDTPARVARMWRDFQNYDPGNHETTFESVTTDQMIVVSGMKVWSFCEHHMLPFWAVIDIGYIPNEKVLGLSKFARIAHKHAHRLQIQERLAEDIAIDLMNIANTPSVAVRVQGQHLCMLMRGIKTEGTMTTNVMKGAFFEKPEARAEFLEACR